MTSSTYVAMVAYTLVFLITTVFMVCVSNVPNSAVSKRLAQFTNPIYAWHLGCWMILGMLAQYLWSRSGSEPARHFELSELLRPLLVSPIVFYAIWTLIPRDKDERATIALQCHSSTFRTAFSGKWCSAKLVINKTACLRSVNKQAICSQRTP
jgi:hypothetical protein